MVDMLVWGQMVCHDMEFCAKDAISPTLKTKRTIAKDVDLSQKYLNKLRLITRMAIRKIMTEKTFGLYVAIVIG
jgi:hypothetical protein